jgi:hypothetical protein
MPGNRRASCHVFAKATQRRMSFRPFVPCHNVTRHFPYTACGAGSGCTA